MKIISAPYLLVTSRHLQDVLGHIHMHMRMMLLPLLVEKEETRDRVSKHAVPHCDLEHFLS